MATADLFNREVRANKSPRNAFNMSYSTLFSSPCGMLLPTYVQEVKMGDKLKLGVSSLTRSSPVSTPAFMSFDEKTDFWFVPFELIWSDYENWRLGQTFRHRTTQIQGAGAQNYLPFTPFWSIGLFFSLTNGPATSVKLQALRYLDLLGYSIPNFLDLYSSVDNSSQPGNAVFDDVSDYYNLLSKSAPCNYFRLAAFQCIYMHAYRNEEYEILDPSYYNVDSLFKNFTFNNTVTVSSGTVPTSSTPSCLSPNQFINAGVPPTLDLFRLFTPRYKNWRKDIFTSAKPTNGFAASTGLEIGSNLNRMSSTYGTGFYWPNLPLAPSPDSGIALTDPEAYSPLSREANESSYNYSRRDWTYQTDGSRAGIVQRLYTQFIAASGQQQAHGLTFLYPQNIRNLMAQDKFSRAAIYADKDISSQVKALFGENYEDEHKPLYLGSYSSNVTVDDVVSTAAGEAQVGSSSSPETSTSILGELAGKVKSSGGKNQVFERSFNKDGVVIGVHYIMPRNNYDSYRLNKWNTKISRFDYFYPQFDGLGYQPILGYERFIDGNDLLENDDLFVSSLYGFAPRYYEYKQRTNEVHFGFQNGQADRGWTLTNNGANINGETASYFENYKIQPDITDRLFNVKWNGSPVTDPFQHYYYYDVTLVSDMEVYGTPSL